MLQGHTVGSLCFHFTPNHPSVCALHFPGASNGAGGSGRDCGGGGAVNQALVGIESAPAPVQVAAAKGRDKESPSEKQHQQQAQHQQTVLFTGDHLALSGSTHRLTGFRAFNHGSPEVQVEYLHALAGEDISFDWILPGTYCM